MIPLGRYRHFKGNLYEVTGLARHSETGDWHVVYRPLYGESQLWVRPLAMFDEMIERSGVTMKRFEFVGLCSE
ncbi:DUF1653 domain-containing protein [uncultured Porticoccus sp.]|uniref:DUF1653 domain-containing protein n=1 Tax=uncultured Porticoccus sp. TaxID=1256050 RepID=UPI00261F7508|nr:DUF1653 domain-containing protein [uncultured Porticoccus sp.]